MYCGCVHKKLGNLKISGENQILYYDNEHQLKLIQFN